MTESVMTLDYHAGLPVPPVDAYQPGAAFSLTDLMLGDVNLERSVSVRATFAWGLWPPVTE